MNPSTFSTDYQINKLLLAVGVLAPIAVDAASDSSYFKFNLDYISFYNLIRLESGSSKSIYQAAYQVLRDATASHQNAMFDLIDRGLNGPNPARDAETAAFLNEWLQRPSRDNPVNLDGVVPVCSGQACQPIPVACALPTNICGSKAPFNWRAEAAASSRQPASITFCRTGWRAITECSTDRGSVGGGAERSRDAAIDRLHFRLDARPRPAESNTQPPPQSLGGVALTVTDSTGTTRVAPLMYVSPSQINFVVPTGTAAGPATFTIANINHHRNIQAVAPTLFSMSGDGRGVAAANAIAVPAANPQLQTPGFRLSMHGIDLRCDADH